MHLLAGWTFPAVGGARSSLDPTLANQTQVIFRLACIGNLLLANSRSANPSLSFHFAGEEICYGAEH